MLLEQHLLIGADLVNSTKAGNSEDADEARKKWYKNADDIAKFLSSINPYWNENDWKNMLYTHLSLTEKEATQLLTQEYDISVTTFDEIEKQALTMANTMAMGIIQQFKI